MAKCRRRRQVTTARMRDLPKRLAIGRHSLLLPASMDMVNAMPHAACHMPHAVPRLTDTLSAYAAWTNLPCFPPTAAVAAASASVCGRDVGQAKPAAACLDMPRQRLQQDAIKRSHRCIKCCCKLHVASSCRRPTCCQVINSSLFWLLLHVCDYRQLLGRLRRVCECVSVCATIAPGHGHGCGHGHGHGLLLSAAGCALCLVACRWIIAENKT